MTEPETPPPESANRPTMGPVRRLLLRALGVVMVGLGAAGAFLPLLPTVPFLLVALWAFTVSSPEWAEKLRRHPRYGPSLIAWEDRKAIPTSAKVAAGTMMAVSWTILAVSYRNPWVVGGVGLLLAVVFAYVVTRPSR
jgi:uncharacterized membrane protein YbaN (DUF454 family)